MPKSLNINIKPIINSNDVTNLPALLSKTDHETVLAAITDSKLTRSEILDIITDKIDAEFDAQLKSLREEKLAALRSVGAKPADVLKWLEKNVDRLRVTQLSQGESTTWEEDVRVSEERATITFALPALEIPAHLLKARAEREKLKKKFDARIAKVEQERQRFNRNKRLNRVAVLMNSLQATPEGRRIMEAINHMMMAIKKKMSAVEAEN